MTDTPTSKEQRQRKLRFRSWHRGMREVDLMLGGFADSQLASLTDTEIDQYEQLLETSDTDLLPWLTGETPVPPDTRSVILDKVMAYCRAASVQR